ncbi:TPA: HlyD family type I secretion periplasmic adaptor subunit [Vibrio alginolyticus]|uniref:HlyD family type I secretion periplasmic adaptor subunit n=1 Tax=Vibrio sp. 1288 TaxID=3074550 RepID=UPI001DB703D3|nr:HlyD family type I secretion periplasmic adaptor subunit [Vibrio sp. 1288]EHA1098873.1 HlyD family type I secretion periplasmic adaptor subunit [Vibrio alginolyticus]EHA1121372.1 HlyD family type I secretion periplasmic adaptor subunit [Vibrio alginolyticus]MDW3135806.1 HlyD family type I secretion periplasmic adaptor subunit [Vibrio sp. 1288]HCZ9262633.1 HlyD family type I secretion periplasmic adaptor subunit [Vibrio alginolyticus]HCZ9294148.1 HlyD family type I secretion periplasmic adap
MSNQLPTVNQSSTEIVYRFSPKARLSFRKPILLGVVTLSVFLGGLGYWAATAKLESAAIAYGDLSVLTKRQEIQHLEGGIIEKLYVQEGDLVEKGQLLIQLSKRQAMAKLDSLSGRFIHTLAKENRLSAELDELPTIVWSDDLESIPRVDIVQEAQLVQNKIFEARKRFFDSKLSIIEQSISGANLELENLQQTKVIETERLNFIDEEIDSNQALVQKGFSGKSTLLQLKRLAAEVRSTLSQLDRQSLTVRKRLDENLAQIEELKLERLNEIVEELRNTKTEIVAIREEYRSAQDIVARTTINAPISGRVVNMQVFTEKGVIGSGETLLELVPQDDKLLVEARVNPQDIDLVNPGQQAHVRLTALNARTLAPLDGTVLTISADKLSQENQEDFYLARIAISPEDVTKHRLTSGMNAEVLILSEPRTPLSYLIKPITESMNRAFREE